MFTGIIQGTGRITARTLSGDAGKLTVEPAFRLDDPQYGESIAVNGACLTLESCSEGCLVFHVMEETFRRTNLGRLAIGSTVNLERAMRADGRFGGHIVTGHIDGVGRILSCGKAGDDTEYVVELPEQAAPYLAPKGSVTLDGISLTLASLEQNRFAVRIIPVTWKETALRFRKPGDPVNIEADLIGKYVHHQLQAIFSGREGSSGKKELTMDDLTEAGFL